MTGSCGACSPTWRWCSTSLAALNLPPLESMTVDDARAFVVQSAANRPPGPDVGEVIDGTLPGAVGELAYRLYRPPTTGPHPIVVYFHGGGWVLGDATSDDPLCRDLCVRTDAIIVSTNYRHAPEHRFPAAVDDGLAAVRWISDNAAALGGIPGQLAVMRLERGSQYRDGGVPARTRSRRTGHRRAGIAFTRDRLRPDPRLLR